MCVKYEDCHTTISGVIGINVAKREQIQVLHEEYLGYYQNY